MRHPRYRRARTSTMLGMALGLLSLPATAHGQATSPPAVTKEVLGDGIYLFRAPSAIDLWTSTNVVVIVNEDDVTVFDSNTLPSTARTVIAEIRKLTSKPVRTLINSHWHMDHWSGNAEYVRAFPGVQIVATTESRDYMKRMGAAFFADMAGGGLVQARAALDTAVRLGKQPDGTPLTDSVRRAMAKDIGDAERLAKEVAATPRVLPTVAFRDTLIFWSGKREFRLLRATGDATGSAVLYLPAERMLVMGDVLVRPETGDGPPPWTTNSYAITPWLTGLRSFAALDATVVVPGQGAAFHDKAYLTLTAELFAAIISQVHAALERGLATVESVQAAVNVDAIGRQYEPGGASPSAPFKRLVTRLVRKVYQESMDGVVR